MLFVTGASAGGCAGFDRAVVYVRGRVPSAGRGFSRMHFVTEE
jgi:hypothetical protein